MRCAWKEFLSILPIRIRNDVDRFSRDTLQELRLRINAPPELVLSSSSYWLSVEATQDDINFVINTASRYSPWAANTSAQGYLTAPGGHRIGLCGEVICQNGVIKGIREVRSICIRIARDYTRIGRLASLSHGSILILGAPGWGKTTLLRDLIRHLAENETVSVVDERGELFPPGFERGKKTDVLTGCPKAFGIEMLLRTMGPSCIAVDEITAEKDCISLIQAANCGVRLLATAHADTLDSFRNRTVYRPLIENKIFDTFLILQKDKSYQVERMKT